MGKTSNEGGSNAKITPFAINYSPIEVITYLFVYNTEPDNNNFALIISSRNVIIVDDGYYTEDIGGKYVLRINF